MVVKLTRLTIKIMVQLLFQAASPGTFGYTLLPTSKFTWIGVEKRACGMFYCYT